MPQDIFSQCYCLIKFACENTKFDYLGEHLGSNYMKLQRFKEDINKIIRKIALYKSMLMIARSFN